MTKGNTISDALFENVTPIDGLDHRLDGHIKSALVEAEHFLTAHQWASSIQARYLGAAIEGVIYVFLFGIEATQADVDEFVWVIVGDVPPAYITCEDAPNPYGAVDGYLGAMEDWVRAAT